MCIARGLHQHFLIQGALIYFLGMNTRKMDLALRHLGLDVRKNMGRHMLREVCVCVCVNPKMSVGLKKVH